MVYSCKTFEAVVTKTKNWIVSLKNPNAMVTISYHGKYIGESIPIL